VFKGVLGFLPNKTHPEIQRELREVLATEGDEWLREHFDLEFIYRHDGHELPPDDVLVTTMADAVADAGREPKISAMTASCDGWFYHNQLHIPTLVIGPGSLGFAHTNEEQIGIDEILQGAAVLVNFMARWCGVEE
jgi:acetylornithine deacetylase